MAAASAQLAPASPHATSPLCVSPQTRFPPINFIYGHFHNSIRAELSLLADRVRSLEVPVEGVGSMLSDLRARYKFLEQVYKYHSAVEDEVLYPTLDSKVPNVTRAYSIEHQDEEVLFEQLSQLLATALEESESKRKGTIRALICKVEEIHTTLRKHLAKEEEQLLPLLLQHFSFAEQAELVAQFLYSIPLETVERVLSQLKPHIPRDEQEQLLVEIGKVIPDNLLSQLLLTWLRPAADMPPTHASISRTERPAGFICCGNPSACMYSPRPTNSPSLASVVPSASDRDEQQQQRAACGAPCSVANLDYLARPAMHDGAPDTAADQVPVAQQLSGATLPVFDRFRIPVVAGSAATGSAERNDGAIGSAPLQDIIHFHRIICSSLADFAREARALKLGRDVTAAHLSALLERHRFLRSVYVFHSISEEEVLFPEVQRLATNVGGMAAQQCEKDHQAELSSFEDLGRMLADVRSFARRGRKEVASMLEKLCCSAEAVHTSIQHHMQREETDVFPLLEAHLCEAQQRVLVYRTIRAMPLRLLERVMPWVVSGLDDAAAVSLLSNIRFGAPANDLPLVELLSRWAWRGRPSMTPLSGSGHGDSGAHVSRPRELPGPSIGHPQTHGVLSVKVQGSAGSGDGISTPEFAGVGGDALDTCAPRPHQESFTGGSASHYVATAMDESRAARKRQRVPDALAHMAAGSFGGDLHMATDVVVIAPDTGAERDSYSVAEMDLSTAPRALMRGPRECGTTGGATPYGSGRALHDGLAIGGSRECTCDGGAANLGGSVGPYNPIDHIFQFHKALRQELKQMEADAMHLEHVVLAWVRHHQQVQPQLSGAPVGSESLATEEGSGQDVDMYPARVQPVQNVGTVVQRTQPVALLEPGLTGALDSGRVATARGGLLPVLQNFHGRFQFLQGIYRAHSKSEDEIVFPALEAKQALRNVSHAYTLDHRQEEQLFADLEAAIDKFRAVDLLTCGHEEELSRQVMGVRRMCAAVRASLETHIRSEESELWPLFTEHFSREEQQYLVGVIIGRTGAQVLQALLPWVSETFSEEERGAMMDSLRAATRNTMFDQWLEAVKGGAGTGASISSGASGSGADSGAPSRASSIGMGDPGAAHASQQPLQDVAEYLAGGGAGSAAGPNEDTSRNLTIVSGGPAPGAVADSMSFRPGWEDIFRMNQQQLEAAIHRVSNDSSLEPERKAYLMQNIMVSKYIVAQQHRMGHLTVEEGRQHLHRQENAARALGQGTSAAGPTASPCAGSLADSIIRRSFHDAAAGILGCKHYRRKCQLVAPCCGKIFTCRLCHDDACDHRMDRYAVSEMYCMMCGIRQPVGPKCCCCGVAMARYVCNICHLFDDEPGKDIYHCPFCNVCRRGRGLGVDFFHCMNCNACMSLTLFSSHKCREKCIEGNCPVCHEALFDSSQPIKELPCGHFMHSSCFLTYTRYNYTCPLCCKSVGDMCVYFQMLDSLLASERLPPEYAGRMQQVLCNDCGKMGFAAFHFVYHSCPHCRSYNTRVL
ncbi:hypothetical protein Vretimale_373 [Volvox reticuliferus]|uniref:Zinc finger protein n=1 Tax=Volvox reticuliferus TaxID=1737510 RepID=A0A8J4G0V4_9CHLO|nr:hypothetical protein Vretifemale_8131 [Volvox reticuliferus]GIL94037.1 hypothetical protein Vretimale_373 [Volvox reticuliferus]